MSSETQQGTRRGRAMLLAVAMVAGLGCGDDTTLSTTGPQDTGTSSGGTSPSTVTLTTVDPTEAITSGVDTTDTATTGDTTGDTTTGDTTGETTTGGETIPGQSINQLVSAGGRAASDLYTVTYTFGQPSQLQSTHASANYSIHGGLIGANGSPP